MEAECYGVDAQVLDLWLLRFGRTIRTMPASTRDRCRVPARASATSDLTLSPKFPYCSAPASSLGSGGLAGSAGPSGRVRLSLFDIVYMTMGAAPRAASPGPDGAARAPGPGRAEHRRPAGHGVVRSESSRRVAPLEDRQATAAMAPLISCVHLRFQTFPPPLDMGSFRWFGECL